MSITAEVDEGMDECGDIMAAFSAVADMVDAAVGELFTLGLLICEENSPDSEQSSSK